MFYRYFVCDVLWLWWQRVGGGTTTLELIWATCLFVEAEEETFFEKISTLLTVTFGPPPGKGGVANFQKIYFKPIYPLLVECQAFNSTLKLQQRILIFFFFYVKHY